ncbi:hypothetical protein LSUB1_G007174 [Lachnellula subtilissima]|uniref:Uncharacterized protein n=1 Tax=Lachnellula subtilissima TaxID=602034 RepID=A0A8H8U444_9HELO|nr:hypothetical protein LSUB1_G007174 [Lachnellula subtilissima]
MKFPIFLSSLALLATTNISLALKPYQIRGVEDPIYHLYLQALPSSPSTAVMGPEASSEYFNISDTIQSTNTSMLLNIGDGGGGVSYLPLSFNATSGVGPWGLEGDTIITTEGSIYGRELNFLVCPNSVSGYYDLYLQTGSDTPSGETCSNYQTIHLPCLC